MIVNSLVGNLRRGGKQKALLAEPVPHFSNLDGLTEQVQSKGDFNHKIVRGPPLGSISKTCKTEF